MKMPPLWRHFCTLNMIILSLMQRREYGVKERIIAVLLALVMLLCGCTPQREEISQPESSESNFVESTPEQSAPEQSAPEVSEEIAFLRENFPRIDGSTSLIPLEAGVRTAIFGKSFDEAQKDVVHSTTWGSFKNLLEGKADLIFSTPISDEQQKMADEAGIKLEQVPVVKEAFVFAVNAKNPVDALSQKQIKDIYSGKITNWKQVGGSDEPIIAYQRNTDSGSQNYMIDFMGETPLMDAPTELRPGSMGGLMDVIAPNDGSLGSIGYSVYAYAADMYGTGDNIKFIKVDGVAPTKETIISGEYPLSSYNYAIFRADEPEEGAVRRLAEWMTSYDGQLAAAKAGYATVEDIGFDYSQSALKKYEAKGTGIAYPGSVPPYEYDIEFKKECEYEGEKYFRYSDAYTFEQRENGTYNAGFICDKELRREVENFVNEAVKTVSADEENMQKFIEKSCSLESGDPSHWYGTYLTPRGLVTEAEIKNGYLSVYVGLSYYVEIQEGYERFYRSETAVWDMISGKRLAPEGLFYDGVDIAEVINEYLGVETLREEDMFIGSYKMKADFAGLTEGGWHLTADAIYFDNDNPYFAYGYKFSLADLPDDVMVTKQPRAVGTRARMIEESKRFRVINTTTHGVISDDDFCTYELLYEDSYPGAKKINEFIENYVKENFTREKVKEYFAGKNVDIDNIYDVYFELGGTDFYTTDLGGKYINFSAGKLVAIRKDKIDGSYVESSFTYPYSCDVYFDPQTGEQIDSNNVERYS